MSNARRLILALCFLPALLLVALGVHAAHNFDLKLGAFLWTFALVSVIGLTSPGLSPAFKN